MTVFYDGEEVEVQKLRYVDSNTICIQLFSRVDGPVCTATINIPGVTGGRMVAIKNYAENTGIEKALIEGNIISDRPSRIVNSGREQVPVYEVTNEFLKQTFSR